MSISIAENRDCMEAMREFPDKFFDLAVVDPPYGGGFTEGGGCQGWFKKYHPTDSSQDVQVERERERESRGRGTALDSDLIDTSTVSRTGGTWAEKYGKKSSRGT